MLLDHSWDNKRFVEVQAMKELDTPPFAPSLIESMRAVGYSLESALADILDNSISAEASNIAVRFSPYDEPYVAVVDDGRGMTRDELYNAMRHGSRNPNDVRTAKDLGRFGLGLKTASLSQARQLTVVTCKDRKLSGARWDLDVIARTQHWTLLTLDRGDISAIPFVDELIKKGQGTIVLWRHLDRLLSAEGSIELGLREGMTRVRQHLALVFHRFLGDEDRRSRVALSMNMDPIVPQDPFLTWHTATQALPVQDIHILGADVTVQPYILPHYTKLTPEELRVAGGEEGLRRQQGFYIYRNKRLIIWGTWFRLAKQEELTKLARVRVDIPNSLDSLWTLDIKKSAAAPPLEVRRNLASIIGRIAEGSGRVYRYRGRRINNDGLIHMWDRREGRTGIAYFVNREHPLFAALAQVLEEAEQSALVDLVGAIEAMLPIDAIYADRADDNRSIEQRPEYTVEELGDLAGRLLDVFGRASASRAKFLSQLALLEPFSFYPDESAFIMQRLADEQ
jgi:hypothetical protein